MASIPFDSRFLVKAAFGGWRKNLDSNHLIMLLPFSQRLIAHVDMNSYFASVEQQADRALRGIPVGVCAHLGKYGCVIAASIEAKKLGAKVGMSVQESHQRIPAMKFVEADPIKYKSVTRRLFALLHELTDRVDHYSIDEAFLDLTGWYPDDLSVLIPFRRLKQRIHDEIGDWLQCSVGVAPTRALAKMASDAHKPNGYTLITHHTLRPFLARRQLQDIAGIGQRMARRLQNANIFTPLHLIDASLPLLKRVGGMPLCVLQAALQGRLADHVQPYQASVPKSVGHSFCVPRRVNRERRVLAVFMKLTERAGRRLRLYQHLACSLSVTITLFSDDQPMNTYRRYAGSETRFTRFSEPASDTLTLLDTALRLLRELWDGTCDVSFLAVTLHELTPVTQQLSFETQHPLWQARDAKRKRVSTALDLVRDKYGSEAIGVGSMMFASGEAPERIGFRKTEDL